MRDLEMEFRPFPATVLHEIPVPFPPSPDSRLRTNNWQAFSKISLDSYSIIYLTVVIKYIHRLFDRPRMPLQMPGMRVRIPVRGQVVSKPSHPQRFHREIQPKLGAFFWKVSQLGNRKSQSGIFARINLLQGLHFREWEENFRNTVLPAQNTS